MYNDINCEKTTDLLEQYSIDITSIFNIMQKN